MPMALSTLLSGVQAPELSLVQWGVIIGASLAAAVTDLGSRRISNALTMPVLLGGLVWAVVAGGGMGLLSSFAAVVMMALPFVLLFVFAGGGAGDAKLMGALGAWLGVVQGVLVLAVVAATGIVFAIGWAVARKRGKEVMSNMSLILMAVMTAMVAKTGIVSAVREAPTTSDMETVPYGVAIFIGVCIAGGGMLLWNAQL